MQQEDRVNSGVIAYGLQSALKDGQVQVLQRPVKSAGAVVQQNPRYGLQVVQDSSDIVMICVLSATSGALTLVAHGDLAGVNTVFSMGTCTEPPVEPAASDDQIAAGPILEMRSTRRSLRDKAREVMSEFEREYPW